MKVLAIPRYLMYRYITSGCIKCDGYCDHSSFFKKYSVISINDDISILSQYGLEAPIGSVLTLTFDDAEPAFRIKLLDGNDLKYFTETQAKEIIDFVGKIDRTKDLYVHCTAGICRSGAVAEFVATKMLGIPYQNFFELNRQIAPNRYVARVLDKVWQEHISKI